MPSLLASVVVLPTSIVVLSLRIVFSIKAQVLRYFSQLQRIKRNCRKMFQTLFQTSHGGVVQGSGGAGAKAPLDTPVRRQAH